MNAIMNTSNPVLADCPSIKEEQDMNRQSEDYEKEQADLRIKIEMLEHMKADAVPELSGLTQKNCTWHPSRLPRKQSGALWILRL